MMSTPNLNDFLLRPMDRNDLEQVLSWRNDTEIRRYMFTQHEIAIDEHTRWFEKVSNDKTRKLLILERTGDAVGFVQFTIQAENRTADWGFYVAPDAPKGTGQALGQVAMIYAFERLGLRKICGQALDFNERSIRFHQHLGFQRESVLRDQYFDGTSYHDLILFDLLRDDWAQSMQDSKKC